jgi:hypothetical protein
MVPTYKGYVAAVIGQDRFVQLHLGQQAALLDLAYCGQAALLNNAAARQSALRADRLSGAWDRTISELKKIAPKRPSSLTRITCCYMNYCYYRVYSVSLCNRH